MYVCDTCVPKVSRLRRRLRTVLTDTTPHCGLFNNINIISLYTQYKNTHYDYLLYVSALHGVAVYVSRLATGIHMNKAFHIRRNNNLVTRLLKSFDKAVQPCFKLVIMLCELNALTLVYDCKTISYVLYTPVRHNSIIIFTLKRTFKHLKYSQI